ncbi:hypothetical protein FJY84_01290, partial [Candidatus Bathyarchaeota archaeon]|nr:hypothetical protein [Candidatus Bathyarchaeota archaeon]
QFAEKIEEQLALKNLNFKDLDLRVENHKINQSKIILKKIDPIILIKSEEKKVESNSTPILELKVAKVLEVKEHPQADKLWILQVDLGTEKRQLCAGLKPYYPNQSDLLGKHLVIVTNLKPTKLREETSQGMLLAADGGSNVGVLLAPNTLPGALVNVRGITGLGLSEITIDIITKLKMEAIAGFAYINGELLKTESETVIVDKKIDGKIR